MHLPDLPFVYLEDRRLTLAAHVVLWLPGRELSRISASGDRIEGIKVFICSEVRSPARQDRDVICARTRERVAGNN
jgi:hypothetical protein